MITANGFLGLAGFYMSFIQNFAEICQPINELTRENVQFQWDDSCETAFSTQKLSSKPVLSFPKLGKPFIVKLMLATMQLVEFYRKLEMTIVCI